MKLFFQCCSTAERRQFLDTTRDVIYRSPPIKKKTHFTKISLFLFPLSLTFLFISLSILFYLSHDRPHHATGVPYFQTKGVAVHHQCASVTVGHCRYGTIKIEQDFVCKVRYEARLSHGSVSHQYWLYVLHSGILILLIRKKNVTLASVFTRHTSNSKMSIYNIYKN